MIVAANTPNPKWKEKIDITYEEYWKTPYEIPHEGLVKLVRTMEEELGKEKAHELLLKTQRRHHREMASKMTQVKPIEKLIDFAEGYMPENWGKRYKAALDGEAEMVSPTEFRLTMRSCLWAKTFREMGAEDIGYIWCCLADNALTEALSPHLKLYRTKTLMMGDDHCNYCWKWEEDEK